MPKMKSHSGAKKRFRLTANGHLKRFKQNKSHILNKKNSKRKMNLRHATLVNKTQEATLRNMISGQK